MRRRVAPFPWRDKTGGQRPASGPGEAAKTRGVQVGPQGGRRAPIAARLRTGLGIIPKTGDADSLDIFDIFDWRRGLRRGAVDAAGPCEYEPRSFEARRESSWSPMNGRRPPGWWQTRRCDRLRAGEFLRSEVLAPDRIRNWNPHEAPRPNGTRLHSRE